MKALHTTLRFLTVATLILSCHSKDSVPIVVLMPDSVIITKGTPMFDYLQNIMERRNKEAISSHKDKNISATLYIFNLKKDSAKKDTIKK